MRVSIIKRLRLAAAVVTGMYPLLHAAAAYPDAAQIQQLIAEGNLPGALNLAERELKGDADNVTYRFLKGLILTRQERLEEARDVFIDITRSNPELPEPYNNLAVVYAALGDFDRARQALEEAINTHPAYATAHENIGDIYAKLASQAYNQALELDTSNNTARAKLSLVNELFSLPDASQVMLADRGGTAAPAEPPAFKKTPVEPAPAAAERAAPPAPAPVSGQRAAQEPPAAAAPPAPAAGVSREVADDRRAAEERGARENAARVATIKQAVLDWARDWSARDVAAYLSHYAGDFTPDDGLTTAVWREQRRDRVGSPGSIRVGISDLVVDMLGEDHAQATFTQVYQSDTYGDRVKKNLLLKREGDRWLITQEQTK